MGTRKPGFDPLSSLFDTSNSSFMDDATSGSFSPQLVADALSMEETIPETSTEDSQSVVEMDKVALARELAKAALARATTQPAETPSSEQGSVGLAARATRPVSALEAARQAAVTEQERRDSARTRSASQLPGRVERMLAGTLSGVRRLEVKNALVMDDRQVLKALWKAHRARMAEHGVLGMVVAATSVLRALDAVPPGQLVVAIVSTDKSEYLVWLDIGSEATISAFPDARKWITQNE